MSHATKEHLAQAQSETNPSIWRDLVPLQLRWIKVFECLVRRAQALCHVTTTLRTYHTWKKPLARQTEQGFDLSHQKSRMLYELGT
jgi:hypothetical protein